MRAPEFWAAYGPLARVLAPLGSAYAAAARWRRLRARPWAAPVPVVCVGNLVAGGAGKTPVALALGAWYAAQGWDAHFLTRGYGGQARGPLRVDAHRHRASEVGDEPLLLARAAPTWIARNRAVGARAAIAAGADIIVMDDGFQNHGLAKTLSLLVFDGGFGIGNGRVLPAGPLREAVADGLARADAVVVMEPDTAGIGTFLTASMKTGATGREKIGENVAPGSEAPAQLLHARLRPAEGTAATLRGRDVFAFAGIGRPAKFFATLEEIGCRVVARHGFPDHHAYGEDEVMRLIEEASARGAVAVTTEKDAVRLPPDARAMVETLAVTVEWRDPAAFAQLAGSILPAGPPRPA